MNVRELKNKIDGLKRSMSGQLNEVESLKIEIALNELKQFLVVTEVPNIPMFQVPELDELDDLIGEVHRVIDQEEKRTQLVRNICDIVEKTVQVMS